MSSPAEILQAHLDAMPGVAFEVVVPIDDVRAVLAESALLRKLVASGHLVHSDTDGGNWVAFDDGVTPDLTDEEVALVATLEVSR